MLWVNSVQPECTWIWLEAQHIRTDTPIKRALSEACCAVFLLWTYSSGESHVIRVCCHSASALTPSDMPKQLPRFRNSLCVSSQPQWQLLEKCMLSCFCSACWSFQPQMKTSTWLGFNFWVLGWTTEACLSVGCIPFEQGRAQQREQSTCKDRKCILAVAFVGERFCADCFSFLYSQYAHSNALHLCRVDIIF